MGWSEVNSAKNAKTCPPGDVTPENPKSKAKFFFRSQRDDLLNRYLCICRTEFLTKLKKIRKKVPRIPPSLSDPVFALRRLTESQKT